MNPALKSKNWLFGSSVFIKWVSGLTEDTLLVRKATSSLKIIAIEITARHRVRIAPTNDLCLVYPL